MDLDLRKLRYFAAVAEERHFGRAAARLFIAQPVLSRQIKAFEQELGCELFERTTRSVSLTPAGDQLYADAGALLAAAEAATRRTLETARGVRRLVVGFAPGLLVSSLIRAYAKQRPDVEVEPLRVRWSEQEEAIRGGQVDVGYLRGEFTSAEVRTVTVGSETQVVCLPATHPLARRRKLTTADLEGETMLMTNARHAGTIEDKFERVALGHGCVEVPRSVAESYSRPDIVHRRLTDRPPHPLCVAIGSGAKQAHVVEFFDLAVDALSQRGAAPGRLSAVS